MATLDKQIFIQQVTKDSEAEGGIITTEQLQTIILNNLKNFDMVQENNGRLSLDYLEAFINAKFIEGRTNKTLKRYDYIIKRMLNLLNVNEQDITVYHLRKYFTMQKEKGISERTLNGERCIFSSYFGWLFNEHLISSNPTSNLNPIKYTKKVRKPFNEVEIERMKEVCENTRDKAIISFLLSSGCRVNELCQLNKSDINLEKKECVVLGKGNKERTCYINEITVMLLSRYFEERTDNLPALFVGKGTERIKPQGIRKMLKKIEQLSGVENVHPHRFRRTLATTLINHGMPIQEVAHILGHEKIDTTMEYVYIENENVKASYKKYA